MSVATELVPDHYIPERARTRRPEPRLASVTTLHLPGDCGATASLRLTRRGVRVLSALAALLALVLVGVARMSAPDSASGSASPSAPALVSVRAGDSVWSIAGRLAPQRDPRAEVADLERINHLTDAALVPGQTLRTR